MGITVDTALEPVLLDRPTADDGGRLERRALAPSNLREECP